MTVIPTKLDGCYLLEPKVFADERGHFFECFNLNAFNKALSLDIQFVQDNQAFSTKGVVRGLHYQLGDYAQAKLVRVIQGKVLDVAVDLRKNSPTFKEYISIELSAENKKQLFVPRGFAHGYITLSDTAEFLYKCDNFYAPEAEGGIHYNDPELNIDWYLPKNEHMVSSKDVSLPNFINARL